MIDTMRTLAETTEKWRINTTPTNRWLMLVGVVMVACAAAVVRLRRTLLPAPSAEPPAQQFAPAPDAPITPESELTAPAVDQAAPAESLLSARWFRWLLFIEGLALLVWLLLNIQPPYSTLVLIGVCVAVVGGILYHQGGNVMPRPTLTTPDLPALPPVTIQRPRRRVRLPHIARLMVVRLVMANALILMIASAYFLAPNNSLVNLQTGALLLLIGGVNLMAAVGLARPVGNIPALPVPALGAALRRFRRIHYLMIVVGGLLLASLLIGPVLNSLFRTALPMGAGGWGLFLRLWGGVILLVVGLSRPSWPRGALLVAGITLLALLSEINGYLLRIETLRVTSHNLQFVILCAGLALVAAGLGGRSTSYSAASGWRRRLQEAGIVLLLTLAALAIRFWLLNDTLRFFVDELSFANAIRPFWFIGDVKLLQPLSSVAAFPNLFVYWQAISVDIFGRNYIGLRGASAMIGALTIPAVYLLGRTLFDRKTAIIGALLLATFPPHIHFSRLGLNNIADALPGTLALAFLARGMLRSSRTDYALGGVFLGLTHYFYEGGRLLYTPLALGWVGLVWIIWRPRIAWRDALVGVVALGIAALPIYYTLTVMDRPLAARLIDHNTLNYWRTIPDGDLLTSYVRGHLLPSVLVYIHRVDSTLFYRGHTALLLAAVFPAAVAGLFYALRRWRMPGLLLLIAWVGCTSAANSLMADSTATTRYVVVFPALMLLAAVGLRYSLPLLLGEGRWLNRALALLAVGLAVFQVNYYFAEHIPLYAMQFRNQWMFPDPQDAALRSVDFPPGTQIYIIHRIEADGGYANGVLQFMTDGLLLQTVITEEFDENYIAALPHEVDFAFFIEARDSDTLALLEKYFYLLPPEMSPYTDIPARQQFVLYYAPYVASYSESLRP